MRGVGVVVMVGLFAACAEDPAAPDRCFPDVPLAVDPEAPEHVFVVDSIDFASSATEAQVVGLDLDCDPQRRPDNALGYVASQVARLGDYDLDVEIQMLIAAGEIQQLVEVKTTSFDDAPTVGVVIRHGEESGPLSGRAQRSVVTAEHGTVPLAVTFPGLGEPFIVDLVGARVVLEGDESRVAGKIGGAVPYADLDTTLIPIFAEGLRRIVVRDCGPDPRTPPDCCVAEDSFGAQLLRLFDEARDCRISADELANNDLVGQLLLPDVDLFDADGRFSPRTDEVKDGLSFGVAFTAVEVSQ